MQTQTTRDRVREWLDLPESERPPLREIAEECGVSTQRCYRLIQKIRRQEQQEGDAA